jgi:signal transduction histidine kinase
MIERLEVIAWATNPQHDNFKSLKNNMTKFATPLCHSKNIQCNIESEGLNEEMQMQGEVRQNIFLVFKEAINNMMKYSEASACNTRMFMEHNQFVLEIKDDGTGFDGIVKGGGSGLKNMEKRTKELNGKLLINSMPEKGTIITMTLPFPFKIPNSWDAKSLNR